MNVKLITVLISTLLLPMIIFAQVSLDVKLFLEGYYLVGSGGNMDNLGAGGCLYVNGLSNNITDVDTITISMVNPVSLLVTESRLGILQTDGNVTANFNTISIGNSYYLKINHKSSIETWSSAPVTMSAITQYDFTITGTAAYGGNLKQQLDGTYAIFSGDVNQNGAINNIDTALVSNGVSNIDTGYFAEDLTGDGVVESLDLSIAENNAFQQIKIVSPIIIGIPEVTNNDVFTLGPNPSQGDMVVNSKSGSRIRLVEVYDFVGNLLRVFDFETPVNEVVLRVVDLRTGANYIKVVSGMNVQQIFIEFLIR